MRLRLRFWTLAICCLLSAGPFILWGQSDGSPWERYTRSAFDAFQKGDNSEAEWQLLNAIQEAEKFDPKDSRLGETHNHLGDVLQAQNKFAEAERSYIQALSELEFALGPEHAKVANALISLGSLYRNQGKFTQAEPVLKRALAVHERASGLLNGITGIAVLNLAWLYDDQSRFSEAEPLYKRALELQEMIVGPDHPEVADTLASLGDLYRNQFRNEEAVPVLKRALAIDEKAYGGEHPKVLRDLRNLGMAYRYTRRRSVPIQERYPRLKEAEELIQRALAISEKTYGPEHQEKARDLYYLGSIYHAQRRFSESEEALTQALAIRERSLDPYHDAVATTLFELAILYEDMQKFSEAAEVLKRLLAIQEHSLESEISRPHFDKARFLQRMATNYNQLADILLILGREEEATTMRTRAIEISPQENQGMPVR